MPTLATKNPMNVPVRMPTANAAARARIQGTPCTLTSTMNSAIVMPLVTPADRSISPSSSTNTSAMASMTSVAAWVRRLAKFRSVRKNGLRKLNRMVSTTNPPTAGRAPISPLRTRWKYARTWSPIVPSWPLPMRSALISVTEVSVAIVPAGVFCVLMRPLPSGSWCR